MYFYITMYHSGVILYQNILITNLYNRYYIVIKKLLKIHCFIKINNGYAQAHIYSHRVTVK
jgi:hypothetical protein